MPLLSVAELTQRAESLLTHGLAITLPPPGEGRTEPAGRKRADLQNATAYASRVLDNSQGDPDQRRRALAVEIQATRALQQMHAEAEGWQAKRSAASWEARAEAERAARAANTQLTLDL